MKIFNRDTLHSRGSFIPKGKVVGRIGPARIYCFWDNTGGDIDKEVAKLSYVADNIVCRACKGCL